MVMETPAVIKLNTFKYNTSLAATQPPIFFHNSSNTSTTSSSTIMGTPQLQYHNTSVFSNTNAQAIYLKPPSDDNLESKSSAPQGVMTDDSEISIFDAQKYFNDTNVTKTRSEVSTSVMCTTDDHDDRAMIGNNNNKVSNPSRLSCGSSSGYNRVRSFHATPTASSEASWNSQTGLLSHPAGGLAVSLRSLPNSTLNSSNQERLSRGSIGNSTAKWFFRRKCPCSGKKSVQVKEPGTNSYIKPRPVTDHVQQHHQQARVSISSTPKNLISPSRHDQFPSNGFHKHQQSHLSGSGRPVNDGSGGGFSFPILNKLSLPKQNNLEEPPRESLEVFQPVDESPAIRKTNGGRGFGFPGSPISRVVALDDDIASDASSDLFEIESFSTQTTSYPTYRRRDSLDEAQNFNSTRRLSLGTTTTTTTTTTTNNNNMYGRRSMDEPMTPSVAPTECYEPSEASIDWSVTTAEGFDRSSVTNFSISASEFEEVTMSRMHNGGGGGKYNNNNKKRSGGGGGLLMSCRQEKAVSVGPQPVSVGQHGGMVPLMSTFKHVGGRVLHNNNNNNTSSSSKNKQQPPLARSHSARLSLAFAA